jgi:TrmH family RNA methyltransferase
VEVSGAVFGLAEGVLERVATTESPQPLLAIVRQRDLPVPSDVDFVVVGDRIADPGNAGTIIRSAEAAGADAVVFTEGSVDPYNPKVVRATAGSLFRIPVLTRSLAEVAALGVQLVATSSHRGEAYTDTDLTARIAVVLGNEAHGVPDDAPVHRWITIPHHGGAESLNVAMAATVLAFEVARQRRGRR